MNFKTLSKLNLFNKTLFGYLASLSSWLDEHEIYKFVLAIYYDLKLEYLKFNIL